MRKKTGIFIGGVCAAAIAALAALYRLDPLLPADKLSAVYLLAALAILSEVLAFLLPRATRGSLAFIPYLAMVVLVPSWVSAIAVLVVKGFTEWRTRTAAYKAIFNVAQHIVGMCLAIMLYRVLGGISLLDISPKSLLYVTQAAGGPAIIAFTASYLTNALLVSAVVAIDSGATAFAVLRDVKIATVGLDLLISPPIFVFAWVYAAFGPIAAATVWVPFLAIRQAHKTNLELAQTNQELLELMVKSLEARDVYTSGHSRRVQQFATIIARALGMNPREIEQVSRAALLHDVGKIHEKYAPILSKTDRLTPDEWITMKEHPVDGADLVATMTKLRDIVPAIRSHHENWDGTGYPDGVAGELIPLAARIIRFADTIDAMTTERPYRAPLTAEQVRAEIVRCRGTQFDPAIADKLLSSSLWSSLFVPPSPVVVSQHDEAVVDIRRELGRKHSRIAAGN